MDTSLLELLPEALELTFFGAGSLLLSLGGAYIERFALLTANHGQTVLGVWIAILGLMAFYFATLLFSDKVRPRLASLV